MKVLFCNRDPNMWDGGDRNKIRRYWEELQELGIECGYAYNVHNMDFNEWDILHIFHLGHEFSYKFHLEALRLGKPTVISPVYFPTQDNPIQYRKEMLEYASALCYLSQEEQDEVERIFENPRKFIVPNGINPVFGEDGPFYQHPNRPSEDYVLCVGRLDERKNQHRLAQACFELDIPLVLVGDPIQGLVTKQCQAVANRWPGLWWEGPAPHDRLAEVYRGAKVLACVSTHEIWPNVVAEGGVSGCNLVVSNGSMSFTDLDGVFTCDPTIESIKKAVDEAYHTPRSGELVEYFKGFTWNKTAEMLKDIYEHTVLASH